MSEKLRLLLGKNTPREPLPDYSRAPKPDSSWHEDGLALLMAGDHATLERRLAMERDQRDHAKWCCLAGAVALARDGLGAAIEHLQAAVAARADFAVAHNPSFRYLELTALYRRLYSEGERRLALSSDQTYPGASLLRHV